MIPLVRALLMGLVRLLIGARGAYAACEPSLRQTIYFANHASHFDTLAVLAAMPPAIRAQTHPVAARDYWGRTPLRRFVSQACLRSVLIDRTRSAQGDPLAPVHACLADGGSVLIFPEGTRADENGIAPFKSGLFHLAQAFPAVDLVPVHLDNLARVMPKGSYLIVPITCTARFGPALTVVPGEEKAAFLARARAAVETLGERAR
ncbi:lysophospholipid acyltransferase family protein [Aureimonas sp. AU12]|uniref:lysophospholipid acyltransferase family protein n=1 Tax=Aureimonas sp. AU12 TaxID=1638161 RepID=UPI0007806AB1|nr:lysophospholipid acyltransferase family protein [Aureimonas sp. AU12]